MTVMPDKNARLDRRLDIEHVYEPEPRPEQVEYLLKEWAEVTRGILMRRQVQRDA